MTSPEKNPKDVQDYNAAAATWTVTMHATPPEKPKRKPSRKALLLHVKTLKEEVADLSRKDAEALQSRAFWRARARVAENELDRALTSLDEEESRSRVMSAELLSWRTRGAAADATLKDFDEITATLRSKVVALESEVEARKEDEAALSERVLKLEADLAGARKALVDRVNAEPATASPEAHPLVVSLEGARFELHRLWRLVKQPNGKLARFSDIVDDFTHFDMDDAEALDVCLEHNCGRDDAMAKVRRARADEPWDTPWKGPADGLNRWRDSLETVQAIHGKAARDLRESGTFTDYVERIPKANEIENGGAP